MNWLTEHAYIILTYFLTKFSGDKIHHNIWKSFYFILAISVRQKYEPINLRKIFNYKNFKCRCTSFENKIAAENTMFLQKNKNNDMLQALLIALEQQQHFDTYMKQ